MVDRYGAIIKEGDFFIYIDENIRLEKDRVKAIIHQPMVGEVLTGENTLEGLYYFDYEVVKV